MTDADKALEIIRAIRDMVNRSILSCIEITQDWGGNSLTINTTDRGHTHIGDPDTTESQLIDELYNQLTHDQGLSWAHDLAATKDDEE